MVELASFSPDVFVFLRQPKRHKTASGSQRTMRDIKRPSSNQRCRLSAGSCTALGRISPYFVADARPTRALCFASIARASHLTERPLKTHVGIHFSHANGKDAHARIFYLNLEPNTCFIPACSWRRTVGSYQCDGYCDRHGTVDKSPEETKKLILGKDQLSRLLRSFDAIRRYIDEPNRSLIRRSL